MVRKFRFINTGANNAAMNMAIDEALLDSDEPVVRVYRWEPAAVSIGYFQEAKDVLTSNFVRRLTGGKAVYHDNELTYSFVIGEKYLPKSIIESYKII